jgi:DNA modification methylase
MWSALAVGTEMESAFQTPLATLYQGDALTVLRELPAESVQMCVTSPPYWAQRDYSLGDTGIGLEPTVEAYLDALVAVFREVRRVLRPDGTLWLNLGDKYAGSGGAGGDYNEGGLKAKAGGTGPAASPVFRPGSSRADGIVDDRSIRNRDGAGSVPGYKPKDLMLLPYRVAAALQADGWWLRSDIIWAKPNPMPEPATDRPTTAHEHIFLLSKAARYFYDADAVREPILPASAKRYDAGYNGSWATARQGSISDTRVAGFQGEPQPIGRNLRSVWEIATQPFPEAHFATFPEAIPRRCILAGSRQGDTVLDPFAGTATTLRVATALSRRSIGIELSADYIKIARKRIVSQTPAMF